MVKPEVADNVLQAVSTADTFFATNPGEAMGSTLFGTDKEGSLRMGGLQPLDERVLDTPRIGLLQREAEMRAEHQAQARITMLNLSRALDESHARQRELSSKLESERNIVPGMQARIDTLAKQLEAHEEKEEERQAQELLRRGFESGNRIFLRAMIEKSREVYESRMFNEEDSVDDGESVYTSRLSSASVSHRPSSTFLDVPGADPRRPSSSSAYLDVPGGHTRRSSTMSTAAASNVSVSPLPEEVPEQGLTAERLVIHGEQQRGPDGELLPEAERPERRKRSKNRASMRKRRHQSVMGEGDKVFFQWILKLWLREAQQAKEQAAVEEEERKRNQREEELKRKMQEEVERRLKEALKTRETRDQDFDKAADLVDMHKARIKRLERQIDDIQNQSAERERQQDATIAQLRNQLDEALRVIRERDEEIKGLKQEIEDWRVRFAKAQAEMDAERRQLQDTIRKISTELQEATVLARYMRETMLKSKRDAAASVSPAKFAELIAQLEDMRDRLNSLRKDYSNLQDDNTDLHCKIERNRRRLELERQFLPLIRQAQGPLGPKVGVSSVCLPSPGSENSSSADRRKLSRSQSASASPPMKGHALAVS